MNKFLLTVLLGLATMLSGYASNPKFYSQVTVSVASGEGTVYASTTSDDDESKHSAQYTTAVVETESSSSSATSAAQEYYLFAKGAKGYAFKQWNDGKTINPYPLTVSATGSKESPTTASYTAQFEPSYVTVTTSDIRLGSVAIDKSINRPGDNVKLTATLAKPAGSGEFGSDSHPSQALEFEGWYDEAGNLLSRDAVFTYTVGDKVENIEGRFSQKFNIKADADGNIAGYYRMQSYSTNADKRHYLTMVGTMKISTSGNERFLTGGAAFGPKVPTWGGRPNDAYARSEEVFANPANIFYVTGKAVNLQENESRKTVANDLRAYAQGTSVNEFVSNNPAFELKAAHTPGYYLIAYSIGTVQRHYFESLWVTTDKPTDNNFKNNGDFDVQPVDMANVDTNYFGAMPHESMEQQGFYWTSMFTSFPYECYADDGVEAYIVNDCMTHEGAHILTIKKLEGGIVPAATPVLLKCQSLSPKENRLVPLLPADSRLAAAEAEATGNLLNGEYGLWTSRTFVNSKDSYHTPDGRPRYKEHMRVFSSNSEGKLGFYKMAIPEGATEGEELASNRVYLDTANLPESMRDATSLKIMLAEDATGINDAAVEGTPFMDDRIYDLYGREVRNPEPRTIYIRNGKKFIMK